MQSSTTVMPSKGGTHQDGLDRALDHLRNETFSNANGIVGILSIKSPDLIFEGYVKAKVGNPELDSLVFDSIIDGTCDWLAQRPNLSSQIKHLETFQFPSAWYL